MCPACDVVIDIRGPIPPDMTGQLPCSGCGHILVHPLGAPVVQCTACATRTAAPPPASYTCHCGLYLAYPPTLSTLICVVCNTIRLRPAPDTGHLAPLPPCGISVTIAAQRYASQAAAHHHHMQQQQLFQMQRFQQPHAIAATADPAHIPDSLPQQPHLRYPDDSASSIPIVIMSGPPPPHIPRRQRNSSPPRHSASQFPPSSPPPPPVTASAASIDAPTVALSPQSESSLDPSKAYSIPQVHIEPQAQSTPESHQPTQAGLTTGAMSTQPPIQQALIQSPTRSTARHQHASRHHRWAPKPQKSSVAAHDDKRGPREEESGSHSNQSEGRVSTGNGENAGDDVLSANPGTS
jgi:LSD1 subclass zinc finger protein